MRTALAQLAPFHVQRKSWPLPASMPNTIRRLGPLDTALTPSTPIDPPRLSGPFHLAPSHDQWSSWPDPASTPKTSSRFGPQLTALTDSAFIMPPRFSLSCQAPSHDQCKSCPL